MRMSTEEICRLDTWKGDWGLPSIDTNCLWVLAYARFCGINLRENPTSDPFKTPNGSLPVLRSSGIVLDSIQKCIEFFREKGNSLEYNLTQKQCAEIMAYDYMLHEKLYPALQFIWWIDQKNFNELIRPWYAKAVPFPFNFWYPARYEKAAHNLMESLFPMEDSTSAIETKVYSEAQKCITLLSVRLGESDFFFGSRPTSFDALVYGYLAPLLKAPLPNPALQNHLKACTNLVKLISRISQRFFESEYQSYERMKAEEDQKKIKENNDTEFPNKRRNQFLAGVFAFVAMSGYAISHGIIKVVMYSLKRRKFVRIIG
ncbi:metaxin-1 isoform X2 [Venturia canescens]|uniref:metaxin-1 isoform X2 n=1 Tax=Venturia canescens TaxID=32260 RepID=UPI001C9D625F|nr:metaxin-1 isoform X2 [Venturia canescens]XP_043277963.1 metaxin-1 isoform X2 [Venturia canescens]